MSDTMQMLSIALGGELLLLLFALLVVSWWRNRAQRKRDSAAIQALIARIKKSKAEREATIEKFLIGQMGMTGEELTQAKVGMLRAELGLLQRFAGTYRRRDAGMAARFDSDFYAALEPYHALRGRAGSADKGSAGESVDAAELEHLRAENSRLSDELKITMETMSRMLNEYSSMFAGGVPDDVAPIASLVGGAGFVSAPQAAEMQREQEKGDAASASGALATDEVLPDFKDGVDEPRTDQTPEADRARGERDLELAADPVGALSEPESAGPVDSSAGDDTEAADNAAVDLVTEATANVADEPEDIPASRGEHDSQRPDDEIPVARGDPQTGVDERLEEGPVEVMGFEEAADLDVEMIAGDEDELFDYPVDDGKLEGQGAAEETESTAVPAAPPVTIAPRKTQSGG